MRSYGAAMHESCSAVPAYDRRMWRLHPRFRVADDDRIALGPGKAELLEAIERTGTIRDAALSLGMSYMRAWRLVREMNEAFRAPLVEASRGGDRRGGAALTDLGRRALALYRQMEAEALRATRRDWTKLQRMLRSLR
jgi:molybdate transport system regulatory protein